MTKSKSVQTTESFIRQQKPDDKKMIFLEWIRTEFSLPPSMSDRCDEHYLRVWDGKFVMENIKDGRMQTSHHRWTVHFASSPEIIKQSKNVACSFRSFAGKNYVVIKVWNASRPGTKSGGAYE